MAENALTVARMAWPASVEGHSSQNAETERSSGATAAGVPTSDLLAEANDLQKIITLLEEHPTLEKALNEQLQQRVQLVSRKYMNYAALTATSGFILGALIATFVMLLLRSH
ncbi:MAG: hypothetical protein H0X24_17015 [Ktedonobacterales bacterium]|nr:hypothetical protein [Ktedonobacterales bacterium]